MTFQRGKWGRRYRTGRVEWGFLPIFAGLTQKTYDMLILLSPAKTMEMSPRAMAQLPTETEPMFADEAQMLVAAMRGFSEEELARMLKISPKLAAQGKERYCCFGQPSNPRKAAIAAYNGSVFRAIDVSSLTSDDLLYAQDRLRIVSILYGLLRPLDRIEAYRLSYEVKLFPGQRSLYDFWSPKLTEPLIADVAAAGGVLVNLASLDVQGAFRMDALRQAVRIVTPEFQERRKGRYVTVQTYAKMCRGAMTRYIIRHRIESPDDLKAFSWNGFEFDAAVSDDDRLVFSREGR